MAPLLVMHQLTSEVSHKNIPTPNTAEYEKQMVQKGESFMMRLHWKKFWADKKDPEFKKFDSHPDVQDIMQSRETYGFKSGNAPPISKDLIPFQEDFWKLIKNLEYEDKPCQTQNKWKKEIKKMKSSNKIMVAGDKSTEYYSFEHDEYQNSLRDKVTSAYKKCDLKDVTETNKKAAILAKTLNLEEYIEKYAESPCFLTLKDHKEGFEKSKPTRPINPAKPEIGKISKHIVEGMVQEIQSKLNVNQWRNTQSVLSWFGNIKDKDKYNFIVFDVVNFYPSITENLLKKVMKWARKYTIISDLDLKIIMTSRETYLFSNESPWAKTGEKSKFDVPMGSFDGAEICELIGLFMLNKITSTENSAKKSIIPSQNIGLYRDDGLAIIRDNNRNIQKIKESIITAFDEENLKIEFEGKSNMKSTNYLDVELDLEAGTHGPYRKPKNKIKFISTKSNHPPIVIKQIKPNVQKRLSMLSSSEEIFKEKKSPYEEALLKSGHLKKGEELIYTPPDTKPKKKKKRKRKDQTKIQKLLWQKRS